MSKDQTSYRQIFKATSLFGGVQVFTIIISIIRTKFIAVLLGPTGMGIAGLLTSTTGFIAALTNFGLERSAVKNIAAADGAKDKKHIAIVIGVLRRLVWLTGILGSLFTLIFSSYLSQLTFGNKDYKLAFIWISITLLLTQLRLGQSAILRGLRQLKLMAKASLWGSFLGLIITIPIYYKFRLDGIVPGIIITAVTTLAFTVYYSRKVKTEHIQITKEHFHSEGKDMLSMGFVLSLSSLVAIAGSYIVRIYIRSFGSIDDVGFYNAGFAIVNTYFGVFFVSLTTDYYPRLASIAHDTKKANLLMNQQSEMSVLILAPILTIFLVFINFIVIILYSQKFLAINDMILWASLGIYFKAASWSLGVIFISKGDVKTLFWSELISNLIMLGLNLICYKFWGLNGLGISFFLSYIYTFIQTFLIVKYKYAFAYSSIFYYIFLIQLSLGTICFIIVKFAPIPWNYIFGIIIIAVASWFSFIHLDKRIGLKELVMEFTKRKK